MKGISIAKFVFPAAQSHFMIEQRVQKYKPDETWHDWVTEGCRPERNILFCPLADSVERHFNYKAVYYF